MKSQTSILRNSLLFIAAILAWPALRVAAQSTPDSAAASAQTPAIAARITQAIDEKQLVHLKGNVHPLARAEFDQGAVGDATPMNRMLMLLQRSPEQQAALHQFMDEQLSKDSPNFQKWLTPEQFGKLYGPADTDIQAVTSWLSSRGFTGVRVNRGKTIIEFNGNVGLVRNVFHADIHKFVVNGENRQANISDPQIPGALTPVVAGIVSLHNFPSKSMRHVVGQFTRTADGRIEPQFTGSGNPPAFFALGPADFAKIYNIPSTLDGTGGNIAIIGFSDIDVSDAHSFRALFGLPVNDPVVVLNGADPGFSGEEGEADLDTQWSGAVAPKATIHYVLSEGTLTSDPLLLGAEYVIDNNSDDVMSLSFGQCEALLTSAQNAFFNTLWEQAAAQGITVTVSAGDNGTAGCDDFNTQTMAQADLAVSGIASTPFNIAVGGTDFDDVGTQISGGFWSASNSTDGKKESALGYIHEVPWNDSCAATATPASLLTCVNPNPTSLLNIVAGSGGPSSLYARPAFQSGLIPSGIVASDAANHRYLPDVSLFASDGPQSKSFYLICQADALPAGSSPSCASTGPFSFFGVGGTSASAPSFAGIMALIGQSEFAAGRSRRQGNANLVLYKIAATPANNCNSSTTPLTGSTTCAFYDVTKGNNSVPCTAGTPHCSSLSGAVGVEVTVNGTTKTPAFSAIAGTGSIPGYDLATGLGTVNVANLATAWPTALGTFKATTSTLLINNSATPGPITHGTAVTAKVTVAVVAPATGTPTGDVSVLGPFNPPTQMNGGGNGGTLASGTVTINNVILPGGTYNATAHYAGDGTFGASDSAGVPVVVNKEISLLQYGIVTFNAAGTAVTSDNATAVGYGSPYILRFDILNHTGTATNCHPLTTGTTTGCAIDATGTVTITDNGNPLDGGSFAINSKGHSEDQPIQLNGGSHTLSATYSGDNSYNASGPVVDTVTVSKATTTTATVASVTTVASGTPMTLTATMSSGSNSAVGTTGTVTFSDGGTQIGSPVNAVPTPAGATVGAGGTAALTWTFTTTGSHSITAAYSGDVNYTASAATAITVTVTSSGSFTVSYGTNPVVLSSTTGANATTAVTVTPTGGFTGMVTVVCPSTLPAGVTCTAPAPINVTSASPVAANLTLSVTATSTTLTASVAPAEPTIYAAGIVPPSAGKGWLALSAGTGLAAILLLLIPKSKRYRAALGLGLICLLSFTLGCNNYSSGGGGGPVATVTQISVPAPGRVASGGTFTFTATVTGGTPTDQVQLFDNGAAIGTGVAVSGGTAALISPALSVGTHKISAHYAGDAYKTKASQSGTLNVTVTGNASIAITTNPAATPPAPVLNVTIN
jgi:hypothetical protein